MVTLDKWRLKRWLHLFSTTIFLRSIFHRVWVNTWSPVQLVISRPFIRKHFWEVSRATSQLHFIPSVPVKIRCFQIITAPWSKDGIRRWADGFVLLVGWDKVKQYNFTNLTCSFNVGKVVKLYSIINIFLSWRQKKIQNYYSFIHSNCVVRSPSIGCQAISSR